jgi:5'-3' exonuclease
VTFDEAGVVAKFGVPPASIADYLALVGDSADGFPGLPGWGAKTSALVLSRWHHVEAIPDDPAQWGVVVRGAANLGATLAQCREAVNLFKDLATLRADAPVLASVDDLRWTGPTPEFDSVCARIGADALPARIAGLARARADA